MLVVDASALVAIGLDEPERATFTRVLLEADRAIATPVNLLEVGIVLSGRWPDFTPAKYGEWLEEYGVLESHDVGVEAALAAFTRYGKGRHPARLNMGDCFAYALAKRLDAPLLFKGNDFPQTDIRLAVQPT